MRTSIDELIQRLKSGEDPNQIRESLLSGPEREILKQCASVRAFDRRLYDFLCSGIGPNVELPSFDDFVQRNDVEPVPRTEGVYRLRDSIREQFRDAWRRAEPTALVPSELQAFSQRMVDYYENLGSGLKLDVLYHALASDPDRAMKLFLTWFQEAEGRFELTQCFDLIRVLEERRAILSPQLRQLMKEMQAQYQARSLWAQDYYQTVPFYPRKKAGDVFGSLLGNSSKWVLQIYATGGMGKTMFLRWAVSRWCVPQRIPCARIDFDLIDPFKGAARPWLLILRFADQLDRQIPGGPFYEIVEELREFFTILIRPATRSSRSNGDPAFPHMPGNERLALEFPDRFASALRETCPNKTILLILDTVEEVVLQEPEAFLSIMGKIADLHNLNSAIRLAVSGRYDLRERVPGFEKRFGSETETLNLTPFSPSEAIGYLTEKRGLDPARHPISAIVDKSEGNPFKLALFADIVRANPSLTDAGIRGYANVDLAYLVERVLERIEDGRIRWVLRYGVVPRKLSLSFLRDIMAKYLPPAMSGTADFDRPAEDLPSKIGKKDLFRTDLLRSPAQVVDFKELWDSLSKFASQYGWITVEVGETDTLSFHPDVVNPMRRLLQKHKVFRLLHQDAAKHFHEKAHEEQERWADWTCEAIYHRFQLDQTQAEAYWRDRVDSLEAMKNLRWRSELAMEILRTEYGGLVSREALTAAHYEAAWAYVEMARALGPSRGENLMLEAQRHAAKAESLSKEPHQRLVSGSRVALVRSAMFLRERYVKAEDVLEGALQAASRPEDRLELELGLADTLAEFGQRPRAIDHYRLALKLALQVQSFYIGVIRARLARLYLQTEEYESAEKEFISALEMARAVSDRDSEADLSIGLSALNRRISCLSRAYTFAFGAAVEFSSVSRIALLHEQGKILLALQRPLEALRICEQTSQLASTPEDKANASELRGRILGELMLFHEAVTQLEQARVQWSEAGFRLEAERSNRWKLLLQLRGVGDLKAVSTQVDYLDRLDRKDRTELEVRSQLLRAEFFEAAGRMQDAVAIVDELWNRQKWLPKMAVWISLEGVAAGQARYLSRLVSSLERVQPDTTRFRMLGELARCPAFSKTAGRWQDLLPFPKSGTPDTHNRAMVLAETARVFGDHKRASKWLGKAREECRLQKNLFAWRQVIDAAHRMNAPNPDDKQFPAAEFLRLFGDYDVLCGAMLLDQVALAMEAQPLKECENLLKRASERLSRQERAPTRWHARLEEVYGELYRRQGRADLVRGHLDRAVQIHEELGDDRSAARVESLYETDRVENTELRAGYSLRLDRTPDGEVIVAMQTPDSPLQRAHKASGVPILVDLLDRMPEETISFRLVKRLAGPWVAAGHELADVLFAPQDLHNILGSKRRSEDLRLETADAGLASAPWEFARVSDSQELVCLSGAIGCFYRSIPVRSLRLAEVKWLQQSLNRLLTAKLLVDGLYGAATQAAVRGFQQSQGLAATGIAGPETRAAIRRLLRTQRGTSQPTILVLQPSGARAKSSTRGVESTGFMSYNRYGFRVDWIEDPTWEQIASQLNSSSSPAVIHIVATLKDSPTLGGVYLDFAGRRFFQTDQPSQNQPDVLTASILNELLKKLQPDALQPLIILDVARPPGLTEAVRQLLLRNLYAFQVFASEGAAGVLATGLGTVQQQTDLWSALAFSLASGDSLTQMLARVRRTALQDNLDDLEECIGPVGTALFAYDPSVEPVEAMWSNPPRI